MNPYQKYVEVTGVRLFQDSKKHVAARFVVVNHSDSEMADLGANEAFHRRLEKLAEKEVDPKEGAFWFYERMRNAYATQLMLDVHQKGKAVVSSGPREQAELDVFRLHEHGLWATMQHD